MAHPYLCSGTCVGPRVSPEINGVIVRRTMHQSISMVLNVRRERFLCFEGHLEGFRRENVVKNVVFVCFCNVMCQLQIQLSPARSIKLTSDKFVGCFLSSRLSNDVYIMVVTIRKHFLLAQTQAGGDFC